MSTNPPASSQSVPSPVEASRINISKIKTIPTFSGKDEDFITFVNKFRCYAISHNPVYQSMIDDVLMRKPLPTWVENPNGDDEQKLQLADFNLYSHFLTALPQSSRELISRKIYGVNGSFVKAISTLQKIHHSARKSRSYYSSIWESYRYEGGDPIDYINLKLLAQENIHPNLDPQEIVDRLFDHLPESYAQAQARVRPVDSVPSAIDEIRAHWRRHGEPDKSHAMQISSKPPLRNSHSYRGRGRKQNKSYSTSPRSCQGCGGNHARSTCPHKEKQCHKCGVIGHLARVCRRGKAEVNQISNKEFVFGITSGSKVPIIHGVLDSGATRHIFPSTSGLINVRQQETSLKVANGAEISTSLVGDLRARIRTSTGEFITISLTDVCVLPGSSYPLISVSRLCRRLRRLVLMYISACEKDRRLYI